MVQRYHWTQLVIGWAGGRNLTLRGLEKRRERRGAGFAVKPSAHNERSPLALEQGRYTKRARLPLNNATLRLMLRHMIAHLIAPH